MKKSEKAGPIESMVIERYDAYKKMSAEVLGKMASESMRPVSKDCNVAIPSPLHERLKLYADNKGLVLRALVAKAVAQYLDRVRG